MARIISVWLGVVLISVSVAAQTSWVKYGDNPVLPAGNQGEWDWESFPGCVLHEDTLYKMWYVGWDGSAGRHGYAISPNGINWTKADSINPIFHLGDPGRFDDVSVETPCILYDGDIYKMWYTGYGGSPAMNRIGYATSSDGLVWEKADDVNPVLAEGPLPWDNSGVWNPTVLYDGQIYKMWYAGYNGITVQIGYATSPDGITWTKADSINPVLGTSPGGYWDDAGVFDPRVLLTDSTYQMWYMGYDGTRGRIGYATSYDGITWNKADSVNPVLQQGPYGSFDERTVRAPWVLLEGSVYKMWYVGVRNNGFYGAGYAANGCDYVIGDVNGSANYNGLDITFGVNFFKYGSPGPQCTACGLCPDWHYCGDVNASCNYNGLDITYGVNYFKFGSPAPIPCPNCPPLE